MFRYGNNDEKLQYYTVKGHTKILNPEKYQGRMVYIHAAFACDLDTCRSVLINIIEYNGTIIT